jgi:gamma-glutamylcyclotransferase
MLYFAFGSNMLPSRLQRRCPTARVKARAIAPGYRVAFDKLSEDTSGKANLVNSDYPGCATGIVYELSRGDVSELDAFEGSGYRRQEDFVVTCIATREELVTCTYVAKERVPGLRPYDWYLALVLAGLARHDIDPSYVQQMRMTAFEPDALTSRTSRRNALRDLESAGYSDYRSLLHAPA